MSKEELQDVLNAVSATKAIYRPGDGSGPQSGAGASSASGGAGASSSSEVDEKSALIEAIRAGYVQLGYR